MKWERNFGAQPLKLMVLQQACSTSARESSDSWHDSISVITTLLKIKLQLIRVVLFPLNTLKSHYLKCHYINTALFKGTASDKAEGNFRCCCSSLLSSPQWPNSFSQQLETLNFYFLCSELLAALYWHSLLLGLGRKSGLSYVSALFLPWV